MQKEIRERSWGTYVEKEDQGRDIAEMPEEKTVAKWTRVGLLWGEAEETLVRLEEGVRKEVLGGDQRLCSRCRFLMGAEAGPADHGWGH